MRLLLETCYVVQVKRLETLLCTLDAGIKMMTTFTKKN